MTPSPSPNETPMTQQSSRKPLSPVTVTAALSIPVGAIAPGVGEVLIDDRRYTLVVHASGYRLHGRDEKRDEATLYDLPLSLAGCDCPDRTYRPGRPGGCRHMVALRQLITPTRVA